MGLFDWFKAGKILYFPGKITLEKSPEIYDNYLEIFKILGFEFFVLSSIKDFGMDLIYEGNLKGARDLANKNYNLLKENFVKKIVVSSPEDYRILKEFYPRFIHDFKIKIEHVSETISTLLKRNGIKIDLEENKKELVVYQDSCYIGKLFGIYEEPRTIIEILGGRISEFDLNREDAFCSGGCGGLYKNFPEISRKMASKRLSQVPKGVGKIITPSVTSYLNMKDLNNDVVEISSFILDKLKGVKK